MIVPDEPQGVHPDTGNAREVLRCIRDTFLGGLHSQYLDREKLSVLSAILAELSRIDEIGKPQVDGVHERLDRANIRCDNSLLIAFMGLQEDES